MSERRLQTLLFIGFTAIFTGYFMVWLPHAAAGLSFIGLEMGEQAKFLPQVSSGQITPGRSLFYVPPVTLAIMLALLSARWSNRRWQTWVLRVVAITISLLAFPAIEAIGTAPAEWLWRVLMIGLAILAALFAPLLGRFSSRLLGLLIAVSALAGALLPAWVFFEVRVAFSGLLRQELGVGIGFWLNLAGHFVVLVAVVWRLSRQESTASAWNPTVSLGNG